MFMRIFFLWFAELMGADAALTRRPTARFDRLSFFGDYPQRKDFAAVPVSALRIPRPGTVTACGRKFFSARQTGRALRGATRFASGAIGADAAR
jgi:hypothetical protein